MNYKVKYVIDFDEGRRKKAEILFPGCETFSDYKEVFDKKDVDLVVNASYSEMHFAITKDLLMHGKHVLTEKPFARNQFECEELINTACDNNVKLIVFHNTQPAPFYVHALDVIKSGILGDVKQIV